MNSEIEVIDVVEKKNGLFGKRKARLELYKKGKLKQKAIDEKYWTKKIHEITEALNSEHDLEIFELKSQIELLESKIEDWEKLKKNLTQKAQKDMFLFMV